MIMGEIIRPTPPQWEGMEELAAWRRHRERQRRPLVYNPSTKTFRPEQQQPSYPLSPSDESLIREVMDRFGHTREQAIRNLIAHGGL
jgi:hypothetical protein